jgi:hypothetical protein
MWAGHWIWSPENDDEQPSQWVFRSSFELARRPERLTVSITADSRYALWINGRYAGQGPGYRPPQQYDVREITALARPGRNTIAVLARYYGAGRGTEVGDGPFRGVRLGYGPFFWYRSSGKAGLLAEVHADGALVAATDARWRVGADRARGWFLCHNMFAEEYDANLAEDWAAPGFDDASWPHAAVRGAPGDAPWGAPVPRLIPFLEERAYVRPRRLVSVREVETSDHALAGDRIGLEPKRALTDSRVGPIGDAGLPAWVEPAPGRGVAIVLEFERTTTGFWTLDLTAAPPTPGAAPASIDIGADETLGPADRVAPNRFNQRPGIVHNRAEGLYVDAYADRYTVRPGRQRWAPLDYRAVRYLQLTIRTPADSAPQRIWLHDVALREWRYPYDHTTGAFSSSDPEIDAVWRMGRDTVQLDSVETFVGSPVRDRTQFTDSVIELYSALYAFGDVRLFRYVLGSLTENVRADGSLHVPINSTTFFWPGMDLLWVTAAWDYYLYTADLEPVAGAYAALQRIIAFNTARLNADSLLPRRAYAEPGSMWWLDWWYSPEDDPYGIPNSAEAPQVSLGINAYFVRALEALARIAAALGREVDATGYRTLAGRVRAAIRRHFWDGRAWLDVQGGAATGEMANGLAILAGASDPERDASVAAHVFVGPKEGVNGRVHPERQTGPGIPSPYGMWWVLAALFEIGRADLALAHIRDLWVANFIARGETMINEDWHLPLNYFKTRAHGYGSAPTYTLSAYVLGVTPLEPGFRRWRVRPQPGGLSHASGRVPTPHGPIEVAWQAGGAADRPDEFVLTLNAPAGTAGEVELPLWGRPGSVLFDGRIVWDEQTRGRDAGRSNLTIDERAVRFVDVEGGPPRFGWRAAGP